jgi:predicted esterase YcpF (UPF0227 family)
MKLNEQELNKLNETNKFIIEWCDYFADFEDDLIFSKDRIKEIIEKEEDIQEIVYEFPGVDDYTEIDVKEILELSDEIKTIQIESKSLIKTKLRRYYIVNSTESNDDYFLREYHDIQLTSLDGIEINLVSESFIIGLAATKLEEYDKDYWGTINQYLAIEIIYKNEEKILDKRNEKELLDSYIFEVADSTGIALILSEIRNPVDEFEELREEAEENSTHALRELEPYNEGMKLFVSAIQINDPELKFLNFYKVLEHFAPIAVNIEANELMRKKLDAPKSSFEDGDFIRSIFELANSMRDKYNDEDLIKATFSTCFDFIGLFKNLPESIKKKIRGHLGGQELNYSTEKQNIITSNNIAAKIIYKTRNKVVHAKSNFALTGDEVELKEMEQLNIFMKEACSQSIRWYSRQPKHLKLEIIK